MANPVEEPQSNTNGHHHNWDRNQWGAKAQRWDRSKWVTVFSSHNPTIREVTECLGMRLSTSASGTNRGIPKFDAPIFKDLSTEVMKMSKEMPKERDVLLDCATDPGSLDAQLDEVLEKYGPQIWGRDADRSRLLTPNPDAEKPTYSKDLFYEDLDDRAIIKTWLHRWIVIKACYYIRNRKIKKPSIGEDESLLDIEPYSPVQKQDQLPHLEVDRSDSALSECKSVTPPTEGGAQQILSQRHESPETNGYPEQPSGAANGAFSRKRSRQSPDPAPRKSPRKSLNSDGSMPRGPGSSGARTRPPSPVNVRFSNTFAAVNRPNGHAVEAPLRPVAPSTTLPSNGVGTPSRRTSVPALQPYGSADSGPGASEVTNVPDRTAGFKPVNPPLGVTIVPINQRQRRSISPRGGREHVKAETTQNGRHTESDPAAHRAPGVAHGSPYQERAHVQSQQRTDGAPSNIPREGLPPMALRDPRAAEPYHSHSVPPAPAASPYHPHIQPHPHSVPPPSNVSHYPPQHHQQPHTQALAPNPHPRPPASAQPPHVVQNGSDMALRQCELLGLLMQFFFPRGPHAFDETVLLQNLNYIWAYNEPSFRQQLGPVYDLHTRVLTTWIEERTRIQQLQHAIDANPAVPPSEMVDRLLAMNDLRVLRLKWRSLTAQDVNNRLLSAEDLLCKTFAAMTKTEGTENMFREGLQALNERVFEFLKTEDMKITVAGT